jgi:hypothetical protein
VFEHQERFGFTLKSANRSRKSRRAWSSQRRSMCTGWYLLKPEFHRDELPPDLWDVPARNFFYDPGNFPGG